MVVNLDDNMIEEMIKAQVNTSVKQRIKEMQGSYTSKGYIEDLIRDIIWDKIIKLCPDVERYIKDEVERCINYTFESQKDTKFTKKQLVEQVVENLMERF